MRKFERWAKDHLKIHKKAPSQLISGSRSPSADPAVTVDDQGTSTNHCQCPSISIDPLVKICRCLKVHLLVPHRHNVAVSLSYDRLLSGRSSLTAGPNPRNDASNALDGTNLDIEDEKTLG